MNTKSRVVSESAYRTFRQFALILCPFTFFFDAAIHFRGKINLSLPVTYILLILLNGGLVLVVTLTIRSFLIYRKSIKSDTFSFLQSIKKKFKEYLPVTLVALLFTVLAGFQFDMVPRYDGGQYYDAIITATQTFSFTLHSLVSSFILLLHPMQGTSLLLGVGEMIFPKQSVGVYGVTLLLSVVSIFCLYQIMGKIYTEVGNWMKAAGTAVFAFCPYVLGLFSHISPDYITMLLFIMLVYTFSEELDYLAAFLTVLLIFSRETGILFAGSFLVPAMLVRMSGINETGFLKKARKYLLPKKLCLYLCGPVLFACYLMYTKGLKFGESFTKKTSFRWDSNGVFCFGINIGYIAVRMEQFLYFNFFWIITLLLFFAIVVLLFRMRRKKGVEIPSQKSDLSLVMGILLSTIVFMGFSCLYITIPCPRYAVSFALPMSIACVGAIIYIWKRKIVRTIVIIGLIVLLLIQNYYNVDPVLTLGNKKINLGYEYIYSPTGNFAFMNTGFVGEMYVYNRTFDYSEDLLSQALRKIDPDKNDNFLFVDMTWYELYMVGDILQTKNLIYWNSVQQKRTYDNTADGSFLLKMKAIPKKDLLPDNSDVWDDDFYLFLTAYQPDEIYCNDLVVDGYTLLDSFRVKNYIGYLSVYHFVRADN